jgi:transcriptional regulator with XRE-family HTH domain
MEPTTDHTDVITLSPQVLLSWRERMGYSQRDACAALGCSRAAWVKWETGQQAPIPRYIGLACAALALGMKPYGDQQSELKGAA